jgi:TonB family protein
MTTRTDCTQAELLAGAIALGEANEAERNAYRAHLAICPQCCFELGGEREIERVMSVAAGAQDGERWAPDLRNAQRQSREANVFVKWAAVLAAIAIVFFGVRAVQKHPAGVTAAVRPPSMSARDERAIATLNTQTLPLRQHQAESLVIGGASTLKLEVSVDAHGVPKHCSIVKSSDYRALDEAACRAVLRTKPPVR